MLQILHVAWIREREIAVAVAAAAAISSSPPVISARVSSVSSSPQVTDLPLPMMQVDDHQESAFAASNAPEAMDDGMHQVALEVEVQVEEMDLDSTTTTTVAPTPTRPLLVSSYAPTGFGEAINPLFLDKEDPYEEEVVIIDEDDHEHNEEENNNDNNTLITLVNNAATASEEQREGGVAEGITATTSIGMAALKLSKEDDEEALLQKTIMAGGKNNTDAPLHYLSPPISPQSSLPLTNSSNNLSSSLSSNSSTLPTPPRKDSLHVVGKSPKSCLKTSSATTTTITSGTHYSIPARLGNTLGSFSLASSNEKSGGDASNQCNSIADSLLEDFMTEADQLFDLNWSLSL